MVNLFHNSKIIGHGFLSDGLYRLKLELNNEYASFHVENSVSKRPRIKDQSYMLWHKRLGHISKERIQRLIKDDILISLDFGDLDTCVDCIRGKLTKTKKKSATRSSDLLEVMHTDISGPYSSTFCRNKYFDLY